MNQQIPMVPRAVSSPLDKGLGNRDSEKCGDLPNIIQQVHSRTELQTGSSKSSPDLSNETVLWFVK